jgi:pyruvate/2-oxoacid:ferredoxin oxidoreductase alpha subunit
LISYPKETPEPISRANSYEHTAQGIITEDIQEREQILTKRKEKEVFLQKEIEEMWYSSKEELHSVVFVSTGSPVFAIKTAMKSFSHISLFLIPVLSPLPHSFPQLDGKTLIFVEQNTSGQLESLIKPRVNAKNIFSLRKNNGDPMLPEDIVEFFLSLSL